MSEELKACPMCGSAAMETEDTMHDRSAYWTYGVECENENCAARVNDFHRKAEAIAAWNRRTPSEPVSREAERRDATNELESAIYYAERHNHSGIDIDTARAVLAALRTPEPVTTPLSEQPE